MKILSPLSRVSEVQPLIEAGADELYCGVVTPEWERRFSYIASINLRHDKVANFSSFRQLEKAVKTASSYHVPVFCAFNAHFYSEQQLPLVLKQIRRAVDAGASKVIVSDIGLISLLREKGFAADIALSTANNVFNAESLSFFKQLGIQRVVLPRHLTVEEVCNLANGAKSEGMQVEAFVLNAICPYIDGLCTLQHIGKSSESIAPNELVCRMPFEVEALSKRPEAEKRVAIAKASVWQNSLPTGCGLCALPFFKKAGICSLKIAGRGNSSEKKIADVKMLRKALGLLPLLSDEEFKAEMHRLFFEANNARCGFSHCYYAGVGLV